MLMTLSTQCVVEFMDDASYNNSDLQEFARIMEVPEFSPAHVMGPYSGGDPDGESTLDVEYLLFYSFVLA